jgi:hypothetical protein
MVTETNTHNRNNSLRLASLHVGMGLLRLVVHSNLVNDRDARLNHAQTNNHTLCMSQVQKKSDAIPPVILYPDPLSAKPIPIEKRQAAQFN